ncbi:MAG: cell division topological specificity factor MinE [Proteobacteria bacterium]|nr:cell division topological specificity factor MinE [Pseudomonadota bacterium]
MLNELLKKWRGTKTTSSQAAKKRLKFAIVYDNLEVSDDILDALKGDIIEVISRYFEIDTKSISLDIDRSEESSSLVLNTPILSAIRR